MAGLPVLSLLGASVGTVKDWHLPLAHKVFMGQGDWPGRKGEGSSVFTSVASLASP